MKKKFTHFGGKSSKWLLLMTMIVFLNASCKKNNGLSVDDASKSANDVSKKGLKLKTASIDPTVTHLALPSAVDSLYSTSLNTNVSDDFNDTYVDFTKWQYRTDGSVRWDTSSSHVYIAQSGSDRFLTLKGTVSDFKGSGISSRTTVKYGFYVMRWQAIGMPNNTANGWHPAIWGAGCDFSGPSNGNCIPECYAFDAHVLEADFMEGLQGSPATWSSHMMMWHVGTVYKDINFKPATNTWPNSTGDWSVMGMEYNPNYIAIWTYASGTWTKVKQIPITSGTTTDTNINSAYRTPLYWILSNYRADYTLITADSWLRIDYFYDYDYIGPV